MTKPSLPRPPGVLQTDFSSFYGVDFVLKSGQLTTCFFATLEEQQAVIQAVYFWKHEEVRYKARRSVAYGFGPLAPPAFSDQTLPLFSAWVPIKEDGQRRYIVGAVVDFREVATAGFHTLRGIDAGGPHVEGG